MSVNYKGEKSYTNASTSNIINYLTGNNMPNIGKEVYENLSKSKGKEIINAYKFLKCYKWEYDNDDQVLILENKFEQISKILNQNKIKELEEDIKNINLDDIFEKNISLRKNEFNIGTLNSLDDLIEDIYHLKPFDEENRNSDKINLIQYIFKYRKIKKDGNDFYRGIIFFFWKMLF